MSIINDSQQPFLDENGNWISLAKYYQRHCAYELGQGVVAEINYTLELVIIRPDNDPLGEIYSMLEAVIDESPCHLSVGDKVEYGLSLERCEMAFWLRRLPHEYH